MGFSCLAKAGAWPTLTLGGLLLVHAVVAPRSRAFGEETSVDVRRLRMDGGAAGGGTDRNGATQRIAWEVRQRTSIETRLVPSEVGLDEGELFDSPFVYWLGDGGYAQLEESELTTLRRFVDLGGFVVVDDVDPENGGFFEAFERTIGRAFPDAELEEVPASHTLFRSFYLLERPHGRRTGPPVIQALMLDGRIAVLYVGHDLAGALARSDDGEWSYLLEGGERQREMAIRFAVNVVMYALCLDYKDDQVHAPFIMRRRGRRNP